MNPEIQQILNDVEMLLKSHRDPGIRQLLITRIAVACESLRGQGRAPDLGPWELSEDGKHLYSDDFTHDVKLTVDGDFYGDNDRLAYTKRLAQQLNGLPKEPPPALIESMCVRYSHDFHLDKYPDQLIGCGWTPEERDGLRRTMRQLYEEVSGHGFFRWENVTESTKS